MSKLESGRLLFLKLFRIVKSRFKKEKLYLSMLVRDLGQLFSYFQKFDSSKRIMKIIMEDNFNKSSI